MTSLGCMAHLVGAVGDDEYGAHIQSSLARYEGLAHIHTVKDCKTGEAHYSLQDDKTIFEKYLPGPGLGIDSLSKLSISYQHTHVIGASLAKDDINWFNHVKNFYWCPGDSLVNRRYKLPKG